MLQYLNQGYRSFGAHPIAPHPRINWEFYAVMEGRCAPVMVNLPEQPLVSRTLWVFPPWAVHGWRGEPGSECRIACFHFAFIPPPLEEMFRNQEVISCKITAEQCRRLSAMAHELRPHFEQPTRLTHLFFQKALFELALMAAGHLDLEPLPALAQSGNSKVERAIAWFFEHMADSPTIEEVAHNINVSPSHLRRLFVLIHKESPRLTFKRLACSAPWNFSRKPTPNWRTLPRSAGTRAPAIFAGRSGVNFMSVRAHGGRMIMKLCPVPRCGRTGWAATPGFCTSPLARW